MQMRFYRTFLQAKDTCDLLERNALLMPQNEHAALPRGEFVKGAVQAGFHLFGQELLPLVPARVPGGVDGVGVIGISAEKENFALELFAPQMIDGKTGDRAVYPCSQAAVAAEISQTPMEPQE